MGFAVKASFSLHLLLVAAFASSQEYLGCFKDSEKRMFGHLMEFPNTLTAELCINNCQQHGYVYAGLQYTFQCFCGKELDFSLKTVESECNLQCPGNNKQKCGGVWRNSVYKIVKPRIGYEYKGCYSDQANPRALSGFSADFSSLTPNLCIDLCSSKGYRYAGLQYGSQCFCGNNLAYNLVQDKECNYKCSGDSSKICGGYWRNAIYYVGYEYKGCYTDQANPRALSGFSISISNLTPIWCAKLCSGKGYKYAGLQYSSECFCGNNLAYNLVQDKECDHKCSGDSSKICGGYWRNSIFYTGA